MPKQIAPPAKFRVSIFMGQCRLSREQIRERVLAPLAHEYRGNIYHRLRRNCNHFSNDLCKLLVSKPIPRCRFTWSLCASPLRLLLCSAGAFALCSFSSFSSASLFSSVSPRLLLLHIAFSPLLVSGCSSPPRLFLFFHFCEASSIHCVASSLRGSSSRSLPRVCSLCFSLVCFSSSSQVLSPYATRRQCCCE
jgi:PPPDE putative peptidase domain